MTTHDRVRLQRARDHFARTFATPAEEQLSLLDALGGIQSTDPGPEFAELHDRLQKRWKELRAADWQPIDSAPEGVVVQTKIDDQKGVRNEQRLKKVGRLWFVPDGSMYVYYEPTHWRAR